MENDELKARIGQIFRDLEEYSYYELLNLTPQATVDEIRASFHRMAMIMHPDNYQQHNDQELRSQLYVIYKRLTEGYRVLTDAAMRREYDQQLAQGHRRMQALERKRSTFTRLEDAIENPQAKRFFLLARDAEKRNDFKTAKINYKFALNLLGENAMVEECLKKIQDKGG